MIPCKAFNTTAVPVAALERRVQVPSAVAKAAGAVAAVVLTSGVLPVPSGAINTKVQVRTRFNFATRPSVDECMSGAPV